MRIIDLLNKIANGEALPKKIKFNHIEYHLIDDYYVDDGDSDLFIYIFKHNIDFSVNDKVEILDDEEEKGLPEKLDIEQDSPTSNYYIRNEYGTKCGLTKHSKIIADKLNSVIDYLEKQRKGE